MAVCAGIKRNGGRCTVSVPKGQEYCHHHDPARAEERSRAARRAGRSRPVRELNEIKSLLRDLTDRVLGDGDAEPLATSAAAVANQLLNTRLRAVELERKIRETEDLEARLEALERAAERDEGSEEGGRRSWGA